MKLEVVRSIPFEVPLHGTDPANDRAPANYRIVFDFMFEPVVLAHHISPGGPLVRQVRGSLLVSSLQTLRELDLYDRYVRALPAAMHEPVLFALAATWLPVDVALAHYAACESLNLDEVELQAMGEHVGKRIMGTFLGTLVRSTGMMRAANPSRALEQFPRLWERLMSGGACDVILKGPKDALIDSSGVPMFRYRYFRVAYVALIRSAGAMIGRKVHTRIMRATETALSVFISWV